MRKWMIGLLATLLFVFAAAPAALALDHRESARMYIGPTETVDDDLLLTGDVAEIEGTVNGDVFAFARTVTVKGTINGNLVAAGSHVEIRGTVTGSAYLAGEDLRVSGKVERSLVTAGGGLVVTPSGTIGRTWLAAGDMIRHEGTVGRALWAGAGTLSVKGRVGQELKAGVRQFSVQEGAVIEGPINYWSSRTGTFAPGIRTGEITFHETRDEWRGATNLGSATGWHVFQFLGFLVVGLLVLALMPGLRRSFPATVTEKPWQVPLAGFLALLAIPVALIVLLLTVVGIPLSLLGMLAMPVVTYVSQVLVSWTAGHLLAERVEGMRTWSWPLVFLVGALLTTLVTLVPGFGGLAGFLFVCYGLGGLYYLAFHRPRTA